MKETPPISLHSRLTQMWETLSKAIYASLTRCLKDTIANRINLVHITENHSLVWIIMSNRFSMATGINLSCSSAFRVQYGPFYTQGQKGTNMNKAHCENLLLNRTDFCLSTNNTKGSGETSGWTWCALWPLQVDLVGPTLDLCTCPTVSRLSRWDPRFYFQEKSFLRKTKL